MDKIIENLAVEILRRATKAGKIIATAESCTGGMVAAALTELAGSSAIFDRGFVTYSNEAKAQMLGVHMAAIDRYGAVSPQVALEMAQGVIDQSNADIAVSITGIAGPSGGSDEKPVGLVYFGLAKRAHPELTQSYKKIFAETGPYETGPYETGRANIRAQANQFALNLILDALK